MLLSTAQTHLNFHNSKDQKPLSNLFAPLIICSMFLIHAIPVLKIITLLFGKATKTETWEAFLDEAYDYILHLRDVSGNLMYNTRRKTGFVGFLVAIKSIRQIFLDLVEEENAPMNYILTYKFSQDHIELFFGAIRSSGGFNNNPTAQQFTAAYKRLLLRSSIEGQNGNCQKQDETEILEAIGDSFKTNDKTVTVNDAAIIRKYDLQGEHQSQHEEDLSDAPNIPFLSEFKTAAISYIAGYVVRMVDKKNNLFHLL